MYLSAAQRESASLRGNSHMSEIANPEADVASDGKIVCHIDNARVHSIQLHLEKNHPDWTVDRYQREYPDAPIYSETAKQVMARNAKIKEAEAQKAAAPTVAPATKLAAMSDSSMLPAMLSSVALTAKAAAFHELFELGTAPAARNAAGDPIQITVLDGHDELALAYLPAIDLRYVFDIDLLKEVIIGFELGMNVYLWGWHGTGKTTVLEQAAARTKRPFMRIQHTQNMQESDVLGQWTVRNGQTEFQLGPLPMAMLNGWVYCADEYDFAMPAVTSVYQPVLEGKPLLIKDAPPMFRQIVPHEGFRFVATGNTNGTGDESGLYQGTLIQNAANYSRFHITEEVKYMEPKKEENVIVSQCAIDRANAAKIVKFAGSVRQHFIDGQISSTISPRELINAVNIGIAYGGNWLKGLELAFANRLSRVDKKTVLEFGQRMF